MIADAAGWPLESISDTQLGGTRCGNRGVTAQCKRHSPRPRVWTRSGGTRANGCGLLLAYESDGYENPRPNRMLELMPHLSVRRLHEAGAAASRFFCLTRLSMIRQQTTESVL